MLIRCISYTIVFLFLFGGHSLIRYKTSLCQPARDLLHDTLRRRYLWPRIHLPPSWREVRICTRPMEAEMCQEICGRCLEGLGTVWFQTRWAPTIVSGVIITIRSEVITPVTNLIRPSIGVTTLLMTSRGPP